MGLEGIKATFLTQVCLIPKACVNHYIILSLFGKPSIYYFY